jgi:hypothetical protein
MKEKIKNFFGKVGKFLGSIIIILIIVSIYKFLNIGGLFNSEIKEYPVVCKEKVVLNKCDNPYFVANPTIYKVSTSRQEVIFWTDDLSPSRTTKCAIRDKKNWSCKYEDESGVFGFNNGIYWATPLGSSSYLSEEMEKEYYPSRTDYLMIKCNKQILCFLFLNLVE